MFLGAGSKMKGLNDLKKYSMARQLKRKILEVRENYVNQMRSENRKDKMLGTATYLIDTLAIRVGNEKNEDEADTVGCCSLRKEHVSLGEGSELTLDFYGKDSMRYFKQSEIYFYFSILFLSFYFRDIKIFFNPLFLSKSQKLAKKKIFNLIR